MDLKNITLKTAELGPVSWENVEKLQPGENGFICFISAKEITKEDTDGEQYTSLLGTYFETGFNHLPTYKEVINMIVTTEYPNGKEQQLLRHGIADPQDEEYVEYYNNVEAITSEIRTLLN